MLFAGLLVFIVSEVLAGHLPNCSIKTVNGINYHDFPNFGFYQVNPHGFYIGFEGLYDVESIHLHVNINRSIRIGEDGDYNGLAKKIVMNKKGGQFGFTSSNPRLLKWHVIHVWFRITTKDNLTSDYLIEPFTYSKYYPIEEVTSTRKLPTRTTGTSTQKLSTPTTGLSTQTLSAPTTGTLFNRSLQNFSLTNP